jgi:hypothetical protein
MCYEWEIWNDMPEKTREEAKPVKKEQVTAPQPAPVETRKPAPVENELEPA